MFTAGKGRRVALGAVVVGAVIALSGCASGDPLADESSSSDDAIIVGSQAYYSNEIVAEIYSQALENAGYTVDRQFQIGAREVYLPEIEDGNIDVFPEYTGSLLQALDPTVESGTSDDVYSQLVEALPEGLTVLDPAEASDQNSWTVTQAFADKYSLTDIASLANVTEPLNVGGNSELQTRPYGPDKLAELYGITVAGFTAVEDSGGPLTVKALVEANDLIALEDPDGLFLPDNIVPVVSDKVDADATDILNEISAALSADALVSMNAESVDEQKSSEEIATEWLTDNGFLE
jgi:osmoprotectant transport system substrate-binding protein